MEKLSVAIQISKLDDALSTHQETRAGSRETEAKLFMTMPARRLPAAVVTTLTPEGQCRMTDLRSGGTTEGSKSFATNGCCWMLSVNIVCHLQSVLRTFHNSADRGLTGLSVLR